MATLPVLTAEMVCYEGMLVNGRKRSLDGWLLYACGECPRRRRRILKILKAEIEKSAGQPMTVLDFNLTYNPTISAAVWNRTMEAAGYHRRGRLFFTRK